MFDDIRNDSRSGASTLTVRAAQALAEIAERSEAADPETFWQELIEAGRELVRAKREMASLVNLVGRVLAAAEEPLLSGLPAVAARRAVLSVCEETEAFSKKDLARLGQNAAALLPDGAEVATLSSSGAVFAALLAARASGRSIRALVGESRPAREGIDLAGRLHASGVPSTVVVDAALPGLVSRCDAVVVGADSISEKEFVNKIGTLPLLLAAGRSGVPALVAAPSDRFIAAGLRGVPGRAHPPSEVLEDAPPGVAVENAYFEAVPLALVGAIVTEEGTVFPEDVEARLEGSPVAPGLLAVLFGGQGGESGSGA